MSLTIEITYYDPKRKQKRTQILTQDWEAEAYVGKLRREGKRVLDVKKRHAAASEPTPIDTYQEIMEKGFE